MNALDNLVGGLRRRSAERISGDITIPARAPRWAPLPNDLHPRLAAALRARGMEQLYSHQAQAWEVARRQARSVVVSTPTASGKSLCFHLPVLDCALREQGRALYLFPTKALGYDQVASLEELAVSGVRAYTFDGDTPADARRAVRTRGDIVVSNPDMLHQAILPHHTKWASFFESLRYVVIDELHVYRGVFGAHVCNVLRRLDRIVRFYGSDPVFITCSATLANSQRHAERLLGRSVELIDDSGAPSGDKRVLLWNPPVINRELGIRRAAHMESRDLANAAVKAGLKTIVFTQTRLLVEVLTKYLKAMFDADPRKPARIAAYRGGYLPTERRRVEKALRADEVDCVVSTSALELGVDIGSLDVAIVNGFPGSINQVWQRFGRAGRSQRTALAVLVANSTPVDQYLARHPEFFMEASPEAAEFDPDQLLILFDHVRCAAFELAFRNGEAFGGQAIDDLLAHLASEQVLNFDGERWTWICDSYPARAVNLRAVADGNFVVVDATQGGRDIIAEVDYHSAALTLYEGAIYMVQSRPWQVERLDWEGRKAFVTRTDVDYYTDAIDYTRVKVLESFAERPLSAGEVAHGEVHVVRRVTGYKKVRFYTHENIGYGPIDLPDTELQTSAMWWRYEPDSLLGVFADRSEALDAVVGAGHALHTVAQIAVMAEGQDLKLSVGGERQGEGPAEPDGEFAPQIILYDNRPGGIGLSEPLYERHAELLTQARRLIEACDCAAGCPACVGPAVGESDDNSLRVRAVRALDLLLEEGGHAAPGKTQDAKGVDAICH